MAQDRNREPAKDQGGAPITAREGENAGKARESEKPADGGTLDNPVTDSGQEVPYAAQATTLVAGATSDVPLSTNAPRGLNEPPANAKANEPAAASLQEHLAGVVAKEQEQGFRGVRVDPTPRENYTLRGVVDPRKQVPETTVVTPRSN